MQWNVQSPEFPDEEITQNLLTTFVIPEQIVERARPHKGKPEVALMRAILEDALSCLLHGLGTVGRRKRRLAREAEEWLLSDDENWPFSFVNVCAVLGLEPGYIRMGLRRGHWKLLPYHHKPKRRVARRGLLME